MNIKEIDLLGYTIKTPSDYEYFKENFTNEFPKISSNYSDSTVSLSGFIVALEKIYEENPGIEKVLFVENKSNDMHDILFHIVDSETKKELKGKGADELYNILVMHYYKTLEGMDDEFSYNPVNDIIETYHFERLNEAPKEERFQIYREMINYSLSEMPESIEKIISSLEQGKELTSEYKKVNLLGFDIDIQTINIQNGIFKLDCSERDVKKLRESIGDLESSYAINLVSEAIKRNNLDLTGKISLSFKTEKDFEYRQYKVEAKDESGKKAEVDLDLRIGAVLPRQEEVFSGKNLDERLELFFSKWDRTNPIRERRELDKSRIEDNYTDVSTFISKPQKKLKMR